MSDEINYLLNAFRLNKKNPIYCTTVRASVFRIVSRILHRETSLGFAQCLGENQPFQMISEKNLLNDKSLDMNVVISRKKYVFA